MSMPSKHYSGFRQRDRMRAMRAYDDAQLQAEHAKRQGLDDVGHRAMRAGAIETAQACSRSLSRLCRDLDEFASVDKPIRDELEEIARKLWQLVERVKRAQGE